MLSFIQLAACAAFAPSLLQRPYVSLRQSPAERIVLQAPPPSPPAVASAPPTRATPAWGERVNGFHDVVSAKSQADAYVARAGAHGDYGTRVGQPAVVPPVTPEQTGGGAGDVVSAKSQADAYIARAGTYGTGKPAAAELKPAPAESLTPELASGGVSGVLGFCSGKACRAFGDAAALSLGATFVFITLLSRAGYLTINYAKVERDLFSLLDTNKGASACGACQSARRKIYPIFTSLRFQNALGTQMESWSWRTMPSQSGSSRCSLTPA